jgi:glutathione S-transferase
MRARMALMISAQNVEIREIILRQKPPAMLLASPKATVPVLVLPDAQVIDQSLDIMHWALAQNDPEAWLTGDDTALITTNDGPFKHHLDRYKYPNRHDSDPLIHRDAGLALLADLDARLSQTSYLCGETRSLADIALFPFIRQFAATDPVWFDAQPLPHLQNWLTGHLQSDLFGRAMIRLPVWVDGQAPVLLGTASLPA